MEILYLSKKFVVINKPVGTPSEKDPTGSPDAMSLTAEELAARKENSKLFLVHRLDRVVGGALVFARTKEAAAAFSALLSSDNFIKEYLAICEGCAEGGTLTDLLFKDSQKNKTFVVKRERKGVKFASLEYKVLSTAEHPEHGKVSLVLIKLHTGRTHQVRVQFASRKMPLLGDGKYGSRDNHCETALWSRRLAFKHPITGEVVEAVSMPPAEYPWNLFDIENLI